MTQNSCGSPTDKILQLYNLYLCIIYIKASSRKQVLRFM